MKKISKILLTLVVTLSLIGCSSKESLKGSKEFSTFVKELPQQLIDNDGFNLNYLFYDASAYGFAKESKGIDVTSTKEYQKSYEDVDALLTELEEYDYDTLTKNQQKEYDILQEYLQRTKGMEEYSYFENNYLGSFVGFQAQLPLLLMEYSFNDKEDVTIYLDALKEAPTAFEKMVDIEKERQKQGVGLSKVLLDKSIEQAETFSKGDNSFLITSFNERMDAISFLGSEEKQIAKQDNEKYVKENLMNAYTTLATKLKEITPEKEDGNLINSEDGKDYYLALFHQDTGLSFTMKELKAYIDDKEKEYTTALSTMMKDNPELAELNNDSINYPSFKTIEENVDYFEGKYTTYYPKINLVDYVAKTVPDSMKDNFSPAAYLTSRIDRSNQPLMIIVNGEYKPTLYDTIAHEGYPGHMYQDSYFQQADVSTFRYLVGCSGYAEGWATYVENNSYRFNQETDQTTAKAMSYLRQFTSVQYCKWDIAINYDGMERKEFYQELEENFGKDTFTKEKMDDMYNTFLETPTNYLKYYITGFYFEDLYNKAKKELGDQFNEVEFHKVILDMGSVGMELVEKYVDQYIKDTKK